MAGDEEPSGKRNRSSADEKEEVGNNTFQDSKMYGEFDEQQNYTGEEQIGDDTNDDGSPTQNSVQNATNSSKSSSDDQRMDLNPTPGPSALSGPKANQSKKKGLRNSRQGTNITEKLFHCTKCGNAYSTKGNMKRHFEEECGVEANFHCSECDFQTWRRRNFHLQANERSQTTLDDWKRWGEPSFIIPVHLIDLPSKAQLGSQKSSHRRYT